jgi:hypothetical protein
MRTIAFAIGIALACATTAFAQGPSPNSGPAAPPGNQAQNKQAQDNQPIRQQVQNNLAKAGYTDIKIMPESFLVRAKDRTGNPVMMIINPDSVTAITEVNPGGSERTTTGSAPRSGNGNSAPSGSTSPQPASPSK